MIQAVNGRKLPAVTVFSEALGYMKKTILSELDAQVVHPNRAILWILTVPAIWSSAAKQVMRIAAENVCANYTCTCIQVQLLAFLKFYT